MILTDGRVDSQQVDEAAALAADLRRRLPSTQIFAVGVGRGVDKHELVRIINENGAHSFYRHPNAFLFGGEEEGDANGHDADGPRTATEADDESYARAVSRYFALRTL